MEPVLPARTVRVGVALLCQQSEGVETKEQLDVLRAEGCVEFQGYYFSPPAHASEVAQMMHEQVRTAANAA